MAQDRESAYSVIQGRMLKASEAAKRLDTEGAKWLVAHATPSDLRELATLIEELATKPAKK